VNPTLALLLLGLLIALSVTVARRTPRTDRDWASDHAVPARITFENGRVRIENLRDFGYETPQVFTESYRDEAYLLEDVLRVWLVLAPFAKGWRGLAHSFLSFELTEGRFVAISAEARREADETYSLIGGLLRRFEVTYVVATEDDLIGLRALRGDRLFLYPTRASPQQARALFEDMLSRAERLRTRPEFYHTLFNNCTTNLLEHVRGITSERLPYGWGVLLPGYSDRLALARGALDTDLSIGEARRHFRVDARAREARGASGSFGRQLREGL